jgi:3D-(3,5/4)-trihydroxycyclohexane-1,2-dione acylhydrolase (decyclizing)
MGRLCAGNVAHGNRPNSYAQAIGVVNALCDPRDRVVTAAGGLPAEVTANWRTLDIGTVDVEFGFSCMGYEIAGGWGARIAQSEREPDRDTIVFVGDGSYLLMNSDIYSSVLSNRKLIILVLDNGGFRRHQQAAEQHRQRELQQPDRRLPHRGRALRGRFRGACGGDGGDRRNRLKPGRTGEAFKRAKASPKTHVIVMKVDAYDGWTTQGHAWWEVGTPHVTENPKVKAAHEEQEATRVKQRKGV